MNENVNIDPKCVKANTTYFKIKIDKIIENEINKLGVNEELYKNFNSKISLNFLEFTNKLNAGGDFNEIMTNLRDQIIAECVEIDKNNSSSMRPFFKEYIFDKIYTMGINIKKGIIPDDVELELEEAKLKMEEENKQEYELEKEKNINEVEVIVEDVTEEKPQDIVDQMWGYFFGNSKTSNPKSEKEPRNKKNEDKDKFKGE